MRRNRQINVSRALALAGSFSFLTSAARACLLPYLTLYLRSLGLSPTETGLVMGTKHLITLVWCPMAGLLSKRYDKRRALINCCLVASAFLALVIPFVPPADVHRLMDCNDNISVISPTPSSRDDMQTQGGLMTQAHPGNANPTSASVELLNGSRKEEYNLSGKDNGSIIVATKEKRNVETQNHLNTDKDNGSIHTTQEATKEKRNVETQNYLNTDKDNGSIVATKKKRNVETQNYLNTDKDDGSIHTTQEATKEKRNVETQNYLNTDKDDGSIVATKEKRNVETQNYVNGSIHTTKEATKEKRSVETQNHLNTDNDNGSIHTTKEATKEKRNVETQNDLNTDKANGSIVATKEKRNVETQNYLNTDKDNGSIHTTKEATKEKRNVETQNDLNTDKSKNSFDFFSSLKAMDIQHQLFFLVLMLVSLLSAALAPLEWTADDGLYEYLDFADASDRYSTSKTWSLIGAAVGVGGGGLLVSQLSCFIATETPRSVIHFVCFAVIALGTIPVASVLPFYLNRKRTRPHGLLKGLQLVRGSVRAILCAITCLLVAMVTSTVENFLLWEMQDHQSTELHMGLSLAFGFASQAAFPFFIFKISSLLSPGRFLTIAAATVAVQCFYFSFLWGPWAVVPAQVLNSLSFGGLWWAIKVQCDDIAIPGTERSVTRVYNNLCLDLGCALGSVIGGLAVQRFGIAWMFRGAAIALMLWCILLPLLQFKVPRQRRINYSRLLAADASEVSESDSEPEKDWLDKAMQEDKSNNNSGRRMYH